MSFRENVEKLKRALERAKSFARPRLFEAKGRNNPWRPYERDFGKNLGKAKPGARTRKFSAI